MKVVGILVTSAKQLLFPNQKEKSQTDFQKPSCGKQFVKKHDMKRHIKDAD